mgnify:FL=1
MIYNKILAYAFFMVGIISIIASEIYERKRKPFVAMKLNTAFWGCMILSAYYFSLI